MVFKWLSRMPMPDQNSILITIRYCRGLLSPVAPHSPQKRATFWAALTFYCGASLKDQFQQPRVGNFRLLAVEHVPQSDNAIFVILAIMKYHELEALLVSVLQLGLE